MIVVGILFALALWFVAAQTLTEFELNVRVLRPWQRTVYGVVAFCAGVALAVLIARGPR